MRVSRRVSRQLDSPLTQIFEFRDIYLDSGSPIDLIDGSQGVPNYPPPLEVMKEIEKASLVSDSYSYTDRRGATALRRAIASDFWNSSGFAINEDEALVTSGCNAAFCVAASTLVDPGDEVIVPCPYYFNHPMWLDMIGAKIREIRSESSGALDLDHILDLITPRTRAIVLVSPGNPTGAIIPPQQLEQFTSLLGQRGVYVILDETYRAFSDSSQPPPFSNSCFDRYPNLVRLLSFSKELAIPGLRVGAACAGESITREMLKVHDCISICTPQISQRAVVTGLKHGSDWKRDCVLNIEEKRQIFTELMTSRSSSFEISSCGGFFAWLRHPFVGMSSWDVTRKLLFEAGLLTLPGSLFGETQETHIRIGLASLSLDDISRFVTRTKKLE